MGMTCGPVFLNRSRALRLLHKISPAQQSLHRTYCFCNFGCLLWPAAPLRLHRLLAQLVADELEGGGDGLVHVVVLVAAQATGKDHVALLRR